MKTLITLILLTSLSGFAADKEEACFQLISDFLSFQEDGVISLTGKGMAGICTVDISKDTYISGHTNELTGDIRFKIEELVIQESVRSIFNYNDSLSKQRIKSCKVKNNTLTVKTNNKQKTGWGKSFVYKTEIQKNENGQISRIKVSERKRRGWSSGYSNQLECHTK